MNTKDTNILILFSQLRLKVSIFFVYLIPLFHINLENVLNLQYAIILQEKFITVTIQ